MDYKQVRVTLTPEAVTALDALIEDCNSKIPFWQKKTNRAGMASATIVSVATTMAALQLTRAELKVLQKEIIREVFLKWRTGTASVRFHEDEWLASKEYEQVSQRFGAELVAEVVK